jgi:chromosome segregation ATPase
MSYSIIATHEGDEETTSLEFKIGIDYVADEIDSVESWDEMLLEIEREKGEIKSEILMLNMFDAKNIDDLNEKKESFDSYMEDFETLCYYESKIWRLQECIRDGVWKIEESY